MKAVKKTLSILLSVLMVSALCVSFGTFAFADDPTVIASGECGAEGNNLTWTLTDDGVLTISGTGAMANFGEYPNRDENGDWIYNEEGNPYIKGPDAPWKAATCVDTGAILAQMGYASQEDAEAAVNNGTFDWDAYYAAAMAVEAAMPGHKVVIGEGVTAIGDNAFKEWNVTEVTLPSTLKQLGYYAFCNGNFTALTLPEGLEYIDEYAISGCDNLESIVIPASVTHIGAYAISGHRLTDVTVLNPALDNFDAGYICVLGAEGDSFPFASVEDYEYFENVKELVTLYRSARSDIPAQMQSMNTYFAQLVSDGRMTQEEADAYIQNYSVQFLLQLKMMLLDFSIADLDAAVVVICSRLNALLGTNLPEADLAEIFERPLYGEDRPETYKEARLAAAADAVLTQKLGHGYVELYDAHCSSSISIAHYCNNPTTSGYTPAPWITISGYCGSPLETYVSTRFPFTKLHDFTDVPCSVEPTCTTPGEKTFFCPICEQTVSGTVPAANHANAVTVPGTEATETEHGCTEGVYCPDCDTWLSGHEAVHNSLGERTYLDEYTEDGEQLVIIKCTVCGGEGLYAMEPIPAEPDAPDDGTNSQPDSLLTKAIQSIVSFFLRLIKWFSNMTK